MKNTSRKDGDGSVLSVKILAFYSIYDGFESPERYFKNVRGFIGARQRRDCAGECDNLGNNSLFFTRR